MCDARAGGKNSAMHEGPTVKKSSAGDGRAERVEFFNRARLRRDCGDDVNGNFISYDARTEQFAVQSGKGAAAVKPDPGERVRAVIMPKNPNATPQAPCAPLAAKPAPTGTR